MLASSAGNAATAKSVSLTEIYTALAQINKVIKGDSCEEKDYYAGSNQVAFIWRFNSREKISVDTGQEHKVTSRTDN